MSTKFKGQISLEVYEASKILALAKAYGIDRTEQHDIIDEIAARAHRQLDDEKGTRHATAETP